MKKRRLKKLARWAVGLTDKEVLRLPDLEHPDITRTLRTGYPNVVAQPEHFGTDVMGHEILTGDDYIELPDGELLLETNLEDYLLEVLEWKFKTAD